nr:MAG TPA_asm: hypothetical protein [Caudoviricetes sp.]
MPFLFFLKPFHNIANLIGTVRHIVWIHTSHIPSCNHFTARRHIKQGGIS